MDLPLTSVLRHLPVTYNKYTAVLSIAGDQEELDYSGDDLLTGILLSTTRCHYFAHSYVFSCRRRDS
jgi:hypothetical protein